MSIPMTTEYEYVLNRGERITHIQHIHLAHLIGSRAKNSLGNTFHRGLKQNLEVKDSTVKMVSLKKVNENIKENMKIKMRCDRCYGLCRGFEQFVEKSQITGIGSGSNLHGFITHP